MASRSLEITGAGVTLILTTVAWVATADFPNDARLVPRLAIGVMVVTALIWLVRAMRMSVVGHEGDAGEPARGYLLRLVAAIVITVAYTGAVVAMGFFLPTFIYIVLLSALLGLRRWRVAVSVSVSAVYCLGIYLVFVILFDRPLPLY